MYIMIENFVPFSLLHLFYLPPTLRCVATDVSALTYLILGLAFEPGCPASDSLVPAGESGYGSVPACEPGGPTMCRWPVVGGRPVVRGVPAAARSQGSLVCFPGGRGCGQVSCWPVLPVFRTPISLWPPRRWYPLAVAASRRVCLHRSLHVSLLAEPSVHPGSPAAGFQSDQVSC